MTVWVVVSHSSVLELCLGTLFTCITEIMIVCQRALANRLFDPPNHRHGDEQ